MIVSVAGAELHCTVRGQGPLCLFPSGIGTKPYERQTPAPITDHLTLVHVDLRGSGRSTGEATDLTFDLLADDLDAVRAALGVERAAVLAQTPLRFFDARLDAAPLFAEAEVKPQFLMRSRA